LSRVRHMITYHIQALIFIFLALSPGPLFASDSCEPQKAHLLSLFRDVIGSVRTRLTHVQGMNILSSETKSEFQQEAEWLIAWLEDESERIEYRMECTELPGIARSAIAQIVPVAALSQKVQATLIIWYIDQLAESVRREMTPPLESELAKLAEARALFQSGSLRVPLRRGAFLLRQVLRNPHIRAILH